MASVGNSETMAEEKTGPNVDSKDQVERIEARRIRIQRRIDAAKR